MNCRSPRDCSAVCRTCPDGLSVTGVSPPTPFASASGTWAHDPPSRPGVPTRPSPARSGSTSTATWLRTSGHGSRNGAPSRHATKKPRVLFSAFSVSPLLPIGSCNQALTGLKPACRETLDDEQNEWKRECKGNVDGSRDRACRPHPVSVSGIGNALDGLDERDS